MSHNYFVKRIISVVLSVCMVMSVALTALPNAATANAITKRVSLTNSEEAGYEVLTFSDFGIADGEILTASSYGTHYISDTLEGNLDKVLFRGKFVFPSVDTSKQFGNIYLGRAKYYGIVLNQDSAGNITLDVISSTTNKSVVENKSATNLTANSSVQLRGNSDLEIAISVKYENTTDTTTDLKIGVWINGTQTTGGYIYARAVALGDLTRCFHTTDYHTPTSVTVKSVTETEKPDSGLLADSEEANYEKLTFSDFGVADGAILTQGSGHVVSEVLEGDLNEVLFRGKYLFPSKDASLKFGNIYLGKANYYSIVLTQDSVGNILFDVISSATGKSAVENTNAKNLTATNTVELRNNEDLEIAISVKYEKTTENTTDLKIGVWFNGVLSGGGYIYAKNVPLTDLVRCFHTTDIDTNTVVKVQSIVEEEQPDETEGPDEPEEILLSDSEEANYENLTFGSFGIADGKILTQGSGHMVSAVLEGDLNEVIFRGKYLFPTMEEAARFGNIYLGKANYYSIVLTQDSVGNILLDVISSATGKTAVENTDAKNLTATNTVELRNNEDLEIAISVKYENTTETTTDLKVGAWINGVLSGGGYIYAKNVPLTDLVRCFHTTDVDTNTAVTVQSVGTVEAPDQVLLADSEEANYENLTLGSFGIADGEILTQGSGHYVSKVLEGDLNEVIFRGKYLFPSKDASLKFGNIYLGKANYYGITLTQDSAGNILLDVISSATNKSAVENKSATNLTAMSTVDLRNNEDLEIAISVKYENTSETTTDLKIGVWINGVLTRDGYIYAKNVPLTDLVRCFHTTDIDPNTSVKVSSVGEMVEPEDVLLSQSEEANYENLTFGSFGIADGEILTQGSGHYVSKTLDGDLDGVIFRGKYLFPTMEEAARFGNIYLGKANYYGITLTQDSAGNILLDVISSATNKSAVENKSATNLTAMSTVNLRNNEDLEIAISVKYENTTETTTDLKIGVWINGVLTRDGYIYAKNVPLTDLVRCFHTTDIDPNTSVKVQSVGEVIEPEDVLLSQSEEANYENLTFGSFGIADGEILTQGSGHYVSKVLEGDLNEVIFRGKYLFPSKDASLKFGNIYLGKANYYGITLTQDNAGNILLDVISSATNKSAVENKSATNLTAMSTVDLRNNEDLEIAISVKYENTTETTTDLKIGVWINGVLTRDGYIYAKEVPLTDLVRCFHTTDVDTNTAVKVSSVGKVVKPEDILLSKSEEANYENLTFGSFGIADGEILNQGSGHMVTPVLEGDLNEVVFRGKYLFPTLEAAARFGNIYLGKANYYGITLTQDSAGNILLDVISSATNKSAVENKSATNLTAMSTVDLRNNEDLEIAVSVKYENTTETTTDLKLGVWINGVLTRDGYIYAKEVPLTDLVRCFHTTDVDPNTSVKVQSVGEVIEPEKILLSASEEANYEKLTFADFGAMDGQILSGKVGEKTTYATLPGTLDGIVFQGKYLFPAMEDAKQFGNIYLGRPDWWAICLTQDSAGNINLSVISDGSSVDNKNLCNLTNGNPQIQLRENKDLEIAISVKYENTTETTTDLKIGVWLNGVLQQGQYIYVRNVLLSDLIRCLHTYDSADDCGVTITSVGEWEVNTLPTDFLDITLSDGNIPDGNTVTWGNFSRISSLNRTLLSANVQFNAVGSRLHLGNTGGAENAYSGMGLRLEKNGTLVLGNELASNETVEPNELASIGLNFFVLHPALAGMGDTFAGKEFLLQISTEFVDYDGGGEANDIKLGVFINGDLYCNNYVYIPNEAQTLATGVNFNGVNEADFARFSSVVLKELTSADLGIKNGTYSFAANGNSAAETLDQTAITTSVTLSGNGSVAFGDDGKGIVFTHAGNNTVAVSHIKVDGTVVDIGQVQIPAGRATELRTTFQFIKAGDTTNLKLGVFVNGKLANYKYFLVDDVDVSVLTKSMSVLPYGSAIRIAANSYEELTLRDFIVADKTRSDYGGRFTSYGEGTYNNTAFSAILTFSDETQQKNGNCFYIGGKDWAGFRVELDANGRLGLSFVHADGVQMKLANINPEDVGMTSFQGKAFTYRVTFDVVESAQGQLDAIIGVYVNDVLCQGKYMTVKGVDPVALERGVFSYIDKNGGSLTMKSTNPVVDFTIFGLNRNWESTLGIQ